MKAPLILVIYRQSTYTEMLSDDTPNSTAEMLRREEPLVSDIMQAHKAHLASMERVKEILSRRELSSTWRHDFSDVNPDDFNLVITVGGDGTVLHASHSIGSTPVLALNSSPKTSAGYFTAGDVDKLPELLNRIEDNTLETTALRRMAVMVNDDLMNARVLNDVLFSHECPASTTRYLITHGEDSQEQTSSGVWVSTAAGSTAAIRAAGGKVMRFGSRRLQFVVREPGSSGGADNLCRATITKGFVTADKPLSIQSKTSTARLYIDGPHVVRPVNFGDIITFYGATEPLLLLGHRSKNNA